jgi:ribosomal-protein-alanine N-acetyltransferase
MSPNEAVPVKRDLSIRWIIRRDLDEILPIEESSFEHPWTEEDFVSCLRQRNNVGVIAEDYRQRKVFGFMIYELHQTKFRILNFAVDPAYRRTGVGKFLFQRMFDKLSQQRRKEITLEVRETNVPAQLFLASLNFKCTSILRDYYIDTSEAAYLMSYNLFSGEEF